MPPDNFTADVSAAAPRRSPWLYVPPPPLYVATFVAALQLGRVVAPHHLVPAAWAGAAEGTGCVIAELGMVLVLSAALLFLRHRTTIVPHARNARELVVQGPFLVTRNPMYVGLTIAYVGAALIVNAAWPLVALALPLWVMRARVIPYEEATMARNFGEAYRQYQARVRRWL